MHRECTQCRRPFTARDLAREVSRGMEAERKALGLQGLLFRSYHCPQCGDDDIFVDLRPLPGESEADFRARRADLERTVKDLHAERAEVVITPR